MYLIIYFIFFGITSSNVIIILFVFCLCIEMQLIFLLVDLFCVVGEVSRFLEMPGAFLFGSYVAIFFFICVYSLLGLLYTLLV